MTHKLLLKRAKVISLRVLVFALLLEAFLRIGGQVTGSAYTAPGTGQDAYRILCIGESITMFGGKDSYPSQLQTILNSAESPREYKVFNRGIPGATTETIAARINKEIEIYQPDAVAMMIGINDVKGTPVYKDTVGTHVVLFINDIRVYKLLKYFTGRLADKGRAIKGMASEKGKEYDTTVFSEEDYLREIKMNPAEPKAYIALGKLYMERKEFKKAEALFERGIKVKKGKKAWGYEELSRCLVLQGEIRAAEDVHRRAIKVNPGKVWPYRAFSRFYASLDLPDDAEAVLRTIPDEASSYYELGDFYRRQKRYEEAISFLQKAIDTNPDDPINVGIYAELGYCYGERGDFDTMDNMTLKSARFKDTAQYFLLASEWYLERGIYARAERILKQALYVTSEKNKINRGLVNVYQRWGRDDLAAQYEQSIPEELEDGGIFPATRANYRRIVEAVLDQGIQVISVQYPMQSVAIPQGILAGIEGVHFVDNEGAFKKAVKEGGYEDYFTDTFAGDFGHCTPAGNHIIAANMADIINQFPPDEL